MTAWPNKPFIYQINTWVWLDSLSRAYNWPITLDNIPDKTLDELASYNVDAIWLMGIWQRSTGARTSALKYAAEYKVALPDLTYDDIIGSAYAIGSYQVEENLGGRNGLAVFRQRLNERGMKLLLDFVPNHSAFDHAWVRVHPDFLVLGAPKDLEKHSGNYYSVRDATGKNLVVAHGRDPYFPGWVDTAQLNAFSPAWRRAAVSTLRDIASQCDGVRCDMAMLLVNDVFAHTWKGHVTAPPATEFWQEVIPQVKETYPDFLFMAEVYWDMEARLQAQGFGQTYDKRLFDRIRDNKPGEIRAHLVAGLEYQKKLVRFIENHDEQRAADYLGVQRSHPAAVLVCTLPGATLLHDGQFVGRRVKLPVQISRQPFEPANEELKAFYLKVLAETRSPIYQDGDWRTFTLTTGTGNGSHENLVTYGWHCDNERRLIVVNLTGTQSQAHIQLENWLDAGQRDWILHDVLDDQLYLRGGDAISKNGLFVDLKPYQSHIFHITRK